MLLYVYIQFIHNIYIYIHSTADAPSGRMSMAVARRQIVSLAHCLAGSGTSVAHASSSPHSAGSKQHVCQTSEVRPMGLKTQFEFAQHWTLSALEAKKSASASQVV